MCVLIDAAFKETSVLQALQYTKYFLSSLQILDQGDLSPGRPPGCVWDLSNVCLQISSCQALEYISLLDAGVRACVQGVVLHTQLWIA